ncbi:MAG: exopolyphosphatase / guanosine-5-triphosphate,3-diphosphate pyrophosphatase [Actinomycetota bacterium]|nr:exopolyphosphatase / guanosine-5-triphosphate,3-diphosphate pyrophosphatase [Actinomycetota bacterium]
MRVAAIDVGTNSARLLVAEGVGDGFRSIDRRMTITRLGQGVDTKHVLSPEALERTFAVIADYAATCGELGVERMRVTGTSAVRDARNREEFFEGVRRLTGSDAELLSGEEEARATFLGTLSDVEHVEPVLVVDIGGGSTELIFGKDEPERLVSLDIGCVRLFEKYLHSDPPTTEEIDSLREEANRELARAKEILNVSRDARLIGVAGTVTQLATLKIGLPLYDPDVTHHVVLSHGDVRALSRRLKSLTYSQRKRIKGLEPGRADVILAGAEILLCVMETFDLPDVLVSEKDILDGLVIQLLERDATV